MEDLPESRITDLVPEFAVKDLPLGRALMVVMMYFITTLLRVIFEMAKEFPVSCLIFLL